MIDTLTQGCRYLQVETGACTYVSYTPEPPNLRTPNKTCIPTEELEGVLKRKVRFDVNLKATVGEAVDAAVRAMAIYQKRCNRFDADPDKNEQVKGHLNQMANGLNNPEVPLGYDQFMGSDLKLGDLPDGKQIACGYRVSAGDLLVDRYLTEISGLRDTFSPLKNHANVSLNTFLKDQFAARKHFGTTGLVVVAIISPEITNIAAGEANTEAARLAFLTSVELASTRSGAGKINVVTRLHPVKNIRDKILFRTLQHLVTRKGNRTAIEALHDQSRLDASAAAIESMSEMFSGGLPSLGKR